MSVPRFWREIPQRYALKGDQCGVCETVYFPPRPICPTCRRDSVGKMEEVRLSGKASLLEWTVVHKPAPGFELQVPYVIGLVQTQEGPMLTAPIVDAEPKDLEPGIRLHAVFRRMAADGDSGVIHYGMKWAPAPGEGGESGT